VFHAIKAINISLHKGRGKNKDTFLRISIDEGRDVPLVQVMNGIKVPGGSKISIVLNPVVTVATQAVKTLEPLKRDCGIPSDISKTDQKYKVNSYSFFLSAHKK
jgi:hypothetical protein